MAIPTSAMRPRMPSAPWLASRRRREEELEYRHDISRGSGHDMMGKLWDSARWRPEVAVQGGTLFFCRGVITRCKTAAGKRNLYHQSIGIGSHTVQYQAMHVIMSLDPSPRSRLHPHACCPPPRSRFKLGMPLVQLVEHGNAVKGRWCAKFRVRAAS